MQRRFIAVKPATLARSNLAGLFHDGAQDAVDAGGVALAVVHEPVIHFAIKAGGHQCFWNSTESRELFMGQRGNF